MINQHKMSQQTSLSLAQGFFKARSIIQSHAPFEALDNVITDRKNQFLNPSDPYLLQCLSLIYQKQRQSFDKWNQIQCQDMIIFKEYYVTIVIESASQNQSQREVTPPKLLRITVYDRKKHSREVSMVVGILSQPSVAKFVMHSLKKQHQQNLFMLFCTNSAIRIITLKALQGQTPEFSVFDQVNASNTTYAQLCKNRLYYISNFKLFSIKLPNNLTNNQSKGALPLLRFKKGYKHTKMVATQTGIATLTKCLRIAIINDKNQKEIIFRTGISIEDILFIGQDQFQYTFLVKVEGNWRIIQISTGTLKYGRISQPLSIFDKLKKGQNTKISSTPICHFPSILQKKCFITIQVPPKVNYGGITKGIFSTLLVFLTHEQVKVYEIGRARNPALDKIICSLQSIETSKADFEIQREQFEQCPDPEISYLFDFQ